MTHPEALAYALKANCQATQAVCMYRTALVICKSLQLKLAVAVYDITDANNYNSAPARCTVCAYGIARCAGTYSACPVNQSAADVQFALASLHSSRSKHTVVPASKQANPALPINRTQTTHLLPMWLSGGISREHSRYNVLRRH